jgi:phospholipid/cholesterol/gamma-HCH transport system substrate-binding protein
VSTDRPLPPLPPARGRYREVWVGIFVVLGLAAGLITLGVMTDAAFFRGRYIVTTTVRDASGIRKGDPVLMRGVNIGRVAGFQISHAGVAVRLEIEGEYPIPVDSHVELKAQGLLGGMFADVVPGSSPRMAKWGTVLPGETGFGLFDKMDSLAGEADKVARKVQNMLSNKTVGDIQGSAAGAHESLAQLQALLKEQRGELAALTVSLRRSAEGIEKVTSGPELERSVKRIDAITQRLDGTIGRLDSSSRSLEAILSRLDRGEGTLGKLLRDDRLYDNASEATANLNRAVEELRKLMADIQAHPRKYVNLKLF